MGRVLCGNVMAINGVNTVRRFTIRKLNDSRPYVASNTKGGSGREEGPFDWVGVYSAYGHTPAVFPGEAFAFVGSTDGSVGFTGTAIVDRIHIKWDIEKKAILEHYVYFSSNGALTEGAAVATDTTSPAPTSSKNMYVALDGTKQTHIRNMELVIVSKNKPYVDSDTDGWTKREKGPIDFQFRYGIYEGTPASLPTMGQDYVVAFYATPTSTWELAWGHIEGYEDFNVDHEGQENVSAVVIGSMSGFSGTMAGWIKNPAGDTKWPAA